MKPVKLEGRRWRIEAHAGNTMRLIVFAHDRSAVAACEMFTIQRCAVAQQLHLAREQLRIHRKIKAGAYRHLN